MFDWHWRCVRRLCNRKRQQFKSAPVFKETIKRLTEGGYKTIHRVLNSSDFGVPQRRKRLFILGIRNDVAKKVGLKTKDDFERLFPTPNPDEALTVREALEGIVTPPEERDFLLTSMRRSSHYKFWRRYWRIHQRKWECRWSIRTGNRTSHWIVRLAQPSPTITSLGQQVGQEASVIQTGRLFTIGELGRLMGHQWLFHVRNVEPEGKDNW